MKIIKSFSLVIAGSLLSTAALAQNAKATPQIATESDLKPVTAIQNASVPAPGAKVVPVAPVEALKPTEQLKPLAVQTTNVNATPPSPLSRVEDVSTEKIEAVAVPISDAMQAKLTEEQKATMAGKAVRPKTIDQTTGATESKLTPAVVKPITAQPIVAPIKEN